MEFISLCLRVDDPGYFRRILAITFTNKAAEELKERILLLVQALITAKADDGLLLRVKELSGADAKQISKRAENAFRLMLFNYADLHVSTIDHFVLGILKSFSKELGLSFDFKVELDQDRIIELMIENLLKNIGHDTFITDALVSYSIAQLDEGKSWNQKNALAEAATQLFREDSSLALELLGDMKDKAIEDGMRQVLAIIKAKQNEILSSAEKGRELMHSSGLTLADFEGKTASVFSILFKDFGNKGYSITKIQHQKIGIEQAGHKASKNKASADAIAPELMNSLEIIDRNCSELPVLDSAYQNRLLLLLAKRLRGILKQLEKEEYISLLSGNNQRIAKVVRGNPAPFIYERLGERYRHFLIDEFQDTSLSQWHNFIPLLDNSLSLGNRNLLVDDAKQSIYRWRNSEVEQIIKPPDIHRKEEDAELERVAKVFKREHDNHALQDNFRSSESIVSFNNGLFANVGSMLAPDLAKAFSDVGQHVKRKEKKGYVMMRFL